MTFRLPAALQEPDDDPAVALLGRYYGRPYLSQGCAEGAHFDEWAPGGDPYRFTADDLIAVSFLSVNVTAGAARALLRDRGDEFAQLLVALGPDRELANEQEQLIDSWPGWQLMNGLRALPGVGNTIASKLLARKRPRLRPIWDRVVANVTNAWQTQWEPVRNVLRADDMALHRRLLTIRDKAGLPDAISALRVLDVICWCEGKDNGY